MKSKIHSRIFAVLLSASLLTSSASAVSLTAMAEESSSFPSASAEYEASGSSIPADAMEAFNAAAATYQGGTLIPLACYGSQNVAGINYKFICRMNSDSQDDLNSLKFVTVSMDNNRVSVITEVSDFDISNYETNYTYEFPDQPNLGGVGVIPGLEACEMPVDAQTIFNRLYDNIVGVSVVPIAFLGKRTNDGTDYVYLIERSAVVPNPDIFIDVLILHEDTDGAAGQRSSHSLLGTRTNYEDDYNDDGKMTYEFKGNFQNVAGYAEGKITLQAYKDATYKLYWADNNRALDGYYPIAELKLKSGESGSVSLGYHTVIPANATKIIAVTDSSYLDTEDAYSVCTLPYYKRLGSASGNLLYTFSTYSDIHIDKGSLWYVNAEHNFKEALKYSTDKNTDFIVVSGDCVTNDSGPDKEWNAYAKVLSESDYVNPVWESDGNHDLRQDVSSGLKSFIKGSGTDGTQSGKSYFSMVEPNSGDLFLFMSIELDKSPNKADVFSDEQLAWAENTIKNYYDNCNIFIVQHSPINGYGAGDRMSDPYYKGLLNQDYSSTKKFKALLEKYPNVMFLSGHTHEDFTMDYNYSDENGTSANMIHTPSLAGSTMPNSSDDGLERNGGKGFNSQGYYVEVYENEVVFYGANITDKKIYPKYSYIMEGSRTSDSPLLNDIDDVPLLNNTVDIRQELDKASYVLTQYYKFASYDSYQWLKKLYYLHKGETTADESVKQQFEEAVNALSKYTGTINYNPLYQTYYFRNNKKWDNVYLYAWTGSSSNASWPGKKLSQIATNENGEGIYKVNFNTVGEYQNIIFNAGSNASQTVDIALHDYKNNGFYISGSSDGKYTVGNYDYNGEVPPENPPHEEPETHDDFALLYYVADEHDWSNHNTLFTYDKNGFYKVSYDASSENNFSFSLYNKTTKKYFGLEASEKVTYALGEVFSCTLKEMSSRGKSVTIYGLSDNAHFDIEYNSNTKEVTVICPQPELPALNNNSSVSAENIKLGETLTLNGASEGGMAPYTYEYYVMKDSQDEWSQLDVSNTASSASYKPEEAGCYNIRVITTDSLGNTADKTFSVTVAPADLKNDSTVSAENVNVGTTVKVQGAATGGTAPYKYAFYYKRGNASSWTVKGTEYGTADSITLCPAYADTYTVMVKVKDSAENVVSKTFTITSSKANNLVNKSTVSAEEVIVGTTVKIKGAAAGGTAPYKYAFYYKRGNASSWTVKGTEYGTADSVTLCPAYADTYTVMVKVKDSAENAASKTFTIKSLKAGSLVNNSTVSAEEVSVGTTVKIKGAAAGGTAPYKYAFYYKRGNASSWTVKGTEYGTADSATLCPSYADTYTVMVKVKDSEGDVASKTFTIKSSKAGNLSNKSTVSAENVKVKTTVKIKGAAAGGTAPYKYAFYYKRGNASSWTVKGTEYGTADSITLCPAYADTYTIMVKVKDSAGNVASKTFTITSTK